MVDGSSNLFRGSYDSTAGYDKKTLIISERRGGRNYWALDMTRPDPDTWKVKWHIQGDVESGVSTAGITTMIDELGYTWSKPFFATIQRSRW